MALMSANAIARKQLRKLHAKVNKCFRIAPTRMRGRNNLTMIHPKVLITMNNAILYKDTAKH
jgi:hypothetical protein